MNFAENLLFLNSLISRWF